MLRALFAMVLCAALAACASAPLREQTLFTQRADRQLLVMLRASPPHFRPDQDYAGGYNPEAGNGSRRALGARIAHEYGLVLLDEWPMPALGVDCLVMQAGDAASARVRMADLARDPRVAWTQPMHTFRSLGDDPLYRAQPVAQSWHLSDLHKLATGRGIVIAEVDSGVDSAHPDLRGRIAKSRNFVDAGPVPAENHGTEVAGVIAAVAGNGIGIVGVAPEARLLALRACWQTQSDGIAECNSFTLAKALQFAVQADPQVLNLSLGGPRDVLLDRLLDLALARGISVIGAADPNAPDDFPAGHAGVLAVAGENEAGRVDADVLLAPGDGIPATAPGGEWNFVHGSSFAAAEVTGLVALLRQISPNASAADVRAALSTRVALGSSVMRRMPIDACAAVARMAGHACVRTIAQLGSTVPRR
ncbi:MAG: S8 family peptidase [Rhodanobacteraceae bacterium]